MSLNINRVVMTGNLTRDPDLRSTPAGTPVCSLRVATNTRRRDAAGEWSDKPNYFDVVVWGNAAESCASYLEKGRPVAIDGRLEWSEWEDADANRRQAVEIVADSVQFLSTREGSMQASGSDPSGEPDDFEPVGVGAGPDEEDIPF